MGEELSKEAGVLDNMHSYFVQQASRLYRACKLFKLETSALGDVLEIGSFYSYTPFLLRHRSASYTLLEGDDPAFYPLEPLCRRYDIAVSYIDLFERFGPVRSASNRLPLPDESCDTILCWETMEHFNFNPVKFVREIHRVLRPGGRVFITVPNRASFQGLVELIFGRGEQNRIEGYYQFENYERNGKTGFLGFHWREYTAPELSHLFSAAGFKVEICGTFTAFQNHGPIGFPRKFLRSLSWFGTTVLPRYGTNVCLIAAP